MEQQEKNIISRMTDKNKIIDLNRLFQIILSRWYIVVLAVLISFTVTYLKLRYTKSLYSASISIKFDDEKNGQLNDIFRYGKVAGRIENQLKTESEILQSRSLALKTLVFLNKRVSYFTKGQIVTSGIYPFTPFNIELIWLDSQDIGSIRIIKFINKSAFTIQKNEKSPEQRYHIQDTLIIGGSIVKLDIPDETLLSSIIGQPIYFSIDNILNNAINFSNSIKVEPKKGTSILDVSFTSDIPEFAADYVNALVAVYTQETVNSKARAAEQTLLFIDKQVEELAKKVDTAQSNLAGFKARNQGMEPEQIGKVEFEKLTNLDAELNILLLKKRILETLERDVSGGKGKPLELFMFDLEEGNELPKLVELLNDLIIERIAMSGKNMPASPMMQENEKKIVEVKKGVLNSLHSSKLKLDEKINSTNELIKDVETKLSSLPEKQQLLVNLERSFKVNEKIYGYLMEKRLETLIGRSSIVPNISTVDYALVPGSPIFPVPRKSYITALIIGLTIGIFYIFIIRLLYNRIPDKETIEALSNTAVIGVIKKMDSEQEEDRNADIYVFKGPKTIFSESIKGIRTNLNIILNGETHKTICVTSSVSGEGKTFCTINLAASFTMLNKKVVIVGCDLRRPKLHLSFRGISNDIGLSTYLIGKNNLEEVLTKTDYDNFYIIPAGPVPPNPGELLQTDKMIQLCETLKKDFDYVLFDTAPVGLVSDSFSLMRNADINLYIIRAQYSKRDFALIPDRLKADNGISNLYSILNSYDNTSKVYGSIYKSEYGGYYGGGGYYYYGGYYGGKGYGYYNKKYYSSYHSGYYADEKRETPFDRLKNMSFFKKKKKNG
jgi:tyrosine-protein kinase Etk/Wzc